jgi:hypothetical protein
MTQPEEPDWDELFAVQDSIDALRTVEFDQEEDR